MITHWGNYSIPFLPSTLSSPSRTLEGLFLGRHALQGAEVPGQHQEQLICILGCTFVKNALVFFVPKIDKVQKMKKAVTPGGKSVLWNPGRISCRCDGGSAGSNRARKRLTCVTNQRHLAFGLHQQRLFGRGQKALQGPAQNFLKKRRKRPDIISF